MADPAETRAPASGGEGKSRRGARRSREPMSPAEIRALARDRLIESRLTPNFISMTGFVLNVVAAVLVRAADDPSPVSVTVKVKLSGPL